MVKSWPVLRRCVISNSVGSVTETCQACQVFPGRPLDLYKGERKSRISGSGDGGDASVLDCEGKAQRFFVKCRDGIRVAQARGYIVRTFVLTESDYAIGMGLDYGRAMNKFNAKFRYDYGDDTGMVWVEHLQGEKVRRNRHVVAWGAAKLNMDDLNDFWLKVYGSLVTWRKKRHGGMIVTSAEEAAKYLSEYFAGEGFMRARFSYNWVFPGWFEYGKWHHEAFGDYPGIAELAALAGLSPVGRLSLPRYRQWYESRQDRLKSALADKILGKSADEVRWLAEYRKRPHGKSRKLDMFATKAASCMTTAGSIAR